jgi:hypothetical protein
MTASQAVNSVPVIDSNPLRRAGVASLLAAWAAAQAVEIEEYCPEQLLRDLGGSFAPRLIVVSIGGDA